MMQTDGLATLKRILFQHIRSDDILNPIPCGRRHYSPDGNRIPSVGRSDWSGGWTRTSPGTAWRTQQSRHLAGGGREGTASVSGPPDAAPPAPDRL